MSKTKLDELVKTAADAVARVETLEEGAAYAGPASEARAAVGALREASGAVLFPSGVVPIGQDVVLGWDRYAEAFAAVADYGSIATALHGRALVEWPALATFARGSVIRARVRRSAAERAVPATREPEYSGGMRPPIETAAAAGARAADEAEATYVEACARAILGVLDAPGVADLLPAARDFVMACDLTRRLDATLATREAAARETADAIEREVEASERAIEEARRSALIQYFEGFASTEFPQVRSTNGKPVVRPVTGGDIAHALAVGQFGAGDEADELLRAEKLRDWHAEGIRREARRVEQLAAIAATK